MRSKKIRLADMPDFLGIAEAAAVLRVHRTTVRHMLDDGRIKYLQLGRVVRIPRAQLECIGREETS